MPSAGSIYLTLNQVLEAHYTSLKHNTVPWNQVAEMTYRECSGSKRFRLGELDVGHMTYTLSLRCTLTYLN
jgi:hypothetical protein